LASATSPNQRNEHDIIIVLKLSGQAEGIRQAICSPMANGVRKGRDTSARQAGGRSGFEVLGRDTRKEEGKKLPKSASSVYMLESAYEGRYI
jgi:ribosomal protein S9